MFIIRINLSIDRFNAFNETINWCVSTTPTITFLFLFSISIKKDS